MPTLPRILLVLLFLLSISVRAEQLSLDNHNTLSLPDDALWLSIPVQEAPSFSTLKALYQSDNLKPGSVLHSTGAYLAKIPLTSSSTTSTTWYVRPNASFVDTGFAFWETEDGRVTPVAEFSQSHDDSSPSFMYSQVFNLTLPAHAQGYLWIYVDAHYYANPLAITFYNTEQFYRDQFTVNTVSVAAVFVMLTLGLIALILFLRLREMITITCAGYLGLHGIGWASLGGLLTDTALQHLGNTTYFGYYLFPFAIACASLYSSLLFNCPQEHFRLARYFAWLAKGCTVVGIVMPFMSFTAVFIIDHIIASVWSITSVAIGFVMYKRYARARFYLFGNLLYSVSLIIFMLTHVQTTPMVSRPELIVVVALATDCFCILLTLADWLYQRQKEFSHSFHLARVDPLTQLGNRYALDEAFARLRHPFVIVFIDFDGLKAINDKYGHEKGDRYLTVAAELMHQQMATQGKLFRTGGDEFVWLFEVRSSQIKKLLAQIQHWITHCEQCLRQQGWHESGISYGIATSLEAANQSDCLALADQRMYEHKKHKKTHKSARLNTATL